MSQRATARGRTSASPSPWMRGVGNVAPFELVRVDAGELSHAGDAVARPGARANAQFASALARGASARASRSTSQSRSAVTRGIAEALRAGTRSDRWRRSERARGRGGRGASRAGAARTGSAWRARRPGPTRRPRARCSRGRRSRCGAPRAPGRRRRAATPPTRPASARRGSACDARGRPADAAEGHPPRAPGCRPGRSRDRRSARRAGPPTDRGRSGSPRRPRRARSRRSGAWPRARSRRSGCARSKSGQVRHQPALAERLEGADAQRPRLRREEILRRLELRERGVHGLEVAAALVGQREPRVQAPEEAHAEVLLQRLDLTARAPTARRAAPRPRA